MYALPCNPNTSRGHSPTADNASPAQSRSREFLHTADHYPILRFLKSKPLCCLHSLFKCTFYKIDAKMKPEYLPTVGRGVQRDLCKLLLNSLKEDKENHVEMSSRSTCFSRLYLHRRVSHSHAFMRNTNLQEVPSTAAKSPFLPVLKMDILRVAGGHPLTAC